MNPNFIRQATPEEQSAFDAVVAEKTRRLNEATDPFFTDDDAPGRLDDDGAPPVNETQGTLGDEPRPLQPPQAMRSAPTQRGQSGAPTRHR